MTVVKKIDKKPVNPIAIRAQANTPWPVKNGQQKTNQSKRQNSNKPS